MIIFPLSRVAPLVYHNEVTARHRNSVVKNLNLIDHGQVEEVEALTCGFAKTMIFKSSEGDSTGGP